MCFLVLPAAVNKVLSLEEKELESTVTTASTGNHALAVSHQILTHPMLSTLSSVSQVLGSWSELSYHCSREQFGFVGVDKPHIVH